MNRKHCGKVFGVPTNLADDGADGKRRRTKTNRFEFEFLNNDEQKMLQQVRCPIYCANPSKLKITRQ